MQKIALQSAGVFFLIVAALHAARLIFKVRVTVGSKEVPLALSWLGLTFCIAFAVWMFLAV